MDQFTDKGECWLWKPGEAPLYLTKYLWLVRWGAHSYSIEMFMASQMSL